ncbi:MAG: RNA polymerase sigma factor [Patescibacteria group bacterium]
MKALHKLTDAILVDRVAAGDTGAFEVLFKRYSAKIYRFIYFRIKDQAIIDDMVNDLFLKIWEMIQSDTRIKNFQALLYKMTRNAIIDHYRTRKEHLDIDTATDITTDEDIFEAVSLEDDIRAMLKVMDDLQDSYKEILQLRYIEDLSHDEIAEVLDKTTGAVKVQIHRAIKQLKSLHSNE